MSHERLLEKATGGYVPFVMMVDANGRLRSEQPRAVGSENSAGQGKGSAMLHFCMKALQMCAPATMFEDSPPRTRRALNGKRHGIDWTALGDHADHLPVLVKLALPQTMWPLGSAPPEFPAVEASRVVLGTHQVRELLDRWWVAAPLAPDSFSYTFSVQTHVQNMYL